MDNDINKSYAFNFTGWVITGFAWIQNIADYNELMTGVLTTLSVLFLVVKNWSLIKDKIKGKNDKGLK